VGAARGDNVRGNLMAVAGEVRFQADGLNLAGGLYFPEGNPRAALCICHGIPSGRPQEPGDCGYPGLAARFARAGFTTLIFNFRGTGGSEGNLDLCGWCRDLEAALSLLESQREAAGLPLFLLGFSGGAAVSVYVAAHSSRVAALVACACPARFGFLTQGNTQAVLEHFRNIGVFRDSDFPLQVERWLEGFSHISPIRHIDHVSPRPLLLLHGDADDVVPVAQAWELYHQAGEPKEIVVVPGAGHRLRLNDQAMREALSWLLQRISV